MYACINASKHKQRFFPNSINQPAVFVMRQLTQCVYGHHTSLKPLILRSKANS